jgi:hypothetical protein
MFEEIPSLSVMGFFLAEMPLRYVSSLERRKSIQKAIYALPSFAKYLSEESFSSWYMAWSEDGLSIEVSVLAPFQKVEYPDFKKGDSLELFLDTRAMKGKMFGEFSHQFVFFPETVGGVCFKEISRFSGNASHPLYKGDEVEVITDISSASYTMKIFLPTSALHGYDTSECLKLSCMYRLHRKNGSSQHFVISSDEYFWERNPSLWAQMNLQSKK